MKYIGWLQLILGIWVLISQWILGFSQITPALWSNLIAGILIIILALWGLFGSRPAPPV